MYVKKEQAMKRRKKTFAKNCVEGYLAQLS